MLMTIAAGAELDIASGDELKAGIAAVRGDIATDPKPIYLSRVGSAIGDGTIMTIDIGSPPTTRIWQLRAITLFGTDDHTVVASITCALYCGNPVQASLASLRLPGLAIPSVTFIPDTAIWAHPTENVFLKTSAVITAGQQIGAVLSIEEWRETDISQNSGAP